MNTATSDEDGVSGGKLKRFENQKFVKKFVGFEI